MNVIVKRALDTDVSIASDSAAVLASVSTFVDTYPCAIAKPTLEYVLDVARGSVTRDGELIEEGFREDWLAPFVERDLYDAVCARAADALLVHGAVVMREGRAMLLFGASGAGKTTMCRALVARGAKYITDEIALIDEGLRARGLPRPLALLADADPPDPREGQVVGYEFIARDDTRVSARFLQLTPERIEHGPAPLAAVVHLRHAPSEHAGFRDLRPSQALSVLWEQRLRAGTREIDIATTLLGHVPAFELTTRDVEGACGDIDAIFRRS